MRQFDYGQALRRWLTPEISNLIASLHECRGKQEFYLRGAPAVLDTLLEVAKIQSAASSNRIEGISTSDARLRALVAGRLHRRIATSWKLPGTAMCLPQSIRRMRRSR